MNRNGYSKIKIYVLYKKDVYERNVTLKKNVVQDLLTPY